MFNQQLFDHNLAYLLKGNPRLKLGEDFSPDRACKKRDHSTKADEWQSWLDGTSQRIVKLPRFLPRSAETAEQWRDDLDQKGVTDGAIDPYIDLHDDIHLRQLMLDLRQATIRSGVDPSDETSVARPGIPLLIALGTGSGEVLSRMLSLAQPFHLLVAVTHWDDFLSSCWFMDWPEIWQRFQADDRYRITLVRVHSEDELLALATKHGLLALEHAYIYLSSSADNELKGYSEVLQGQKVENQVHYLGYTIDEYNMVYNSAETLKRSPRILQAPPKPTSARFLICGSGPSLDEDLDIIRELSVDHVIVAGGSNYRTLRAAGIDPHFLTLVERGYETYNDYATSVHDYGRSSTRLVMSSTCPADLTDLFGETAIYFRPALTPLAVFSDHQAEILNYEGPESINTAMAFALAAGASSVVCFGVDLGTPDPARGRSKAAAGASSRQWNIIQAGNLRESVYTNRNQMDARLMLEIAIAAHKERVQVFNCSDGLSVEGAIPMRPDDYLARHRADGPLAGSWDAVEAWWQQLPIYTSERLASSWRARRPRESTFRLARQLQELFEGSTLWFPDVLDQLHQLLSLEVPLRDQFPRRIMRSTVYKGALAVTQQFQIMFKAPVEQQLQFGAEARALLSAMVQRMENEIYAICDAVES